MFFILLVLASLCVSGLSTTVQKRCPSRLQRDKYLKVYGNKCYQFVVYEKKTFLDAQRQCQQGGGNLAIVKSHSVNTFLEHELKNSYKLNTPVWIGLRAAITPRNRYYPKWVDGSWLGHYNNFYHYHVPDYQTIYRTPLCVAMVTYHDNNWFQYPCHVANDSEDSKHAFVCEYPLQSIRKPVRITTSTTTTTPSTTITTLPPTTTLPSTTTAQPTTTLPSTTAQPTTTLPTTTQPTTTAQPTTTTLPATTTLPTATTLPIITTTTMTPRTTTPQTTTTQTKTTTPRSATTTLPPTPPPTTTTTTPPLQTTTTTRMTTTYACPDIICEKDCGLNGYARNPVTRCMECVCNLP